MRALLLAAGVAAAKSPAEQDAERQLLIDDVNGKQSLWRAGHNPRFRGAPVGVSKALCGVLPGHQKVLNDAITRGEIEVAQYSGRALPADFDSATNWPKCAKMIGDIRDQSNCGCCWAFGSAEAASDRMCIATNGTIEIPLSAQDLCFCSNSNGCGGGYPASAWNHIKNTGLVSGSQQQPDDGKTDPYAGLGLCSSFSLPHCHHHGPTGSDPYPAEGAAGCPTENSPQCPTKCDASAKAPHSDFNNDKYRFSGSTASYSNADTMAEAIMQGGPVTVAFTVYSDFENYAGGIYKHTSGSSLGGHAVKIVGFGTDNGQKYWKVANSWNPYWGENGYFRIVRGVNDCGIEQQGVSSSSGAQWYAPGQGPPPTPPGSQVCTFDTCSGCSSYCGGNSRCSTGSGGLTCDCTSDPSMSCHKP